MKIKNWDKLTNNLDLIFFNAEFKYDPDINDMLGLNCSPKYVHKVSLLWPKRVADLQIDVIVFPLDHMICLGIARFGEKCETLVNITIDSIKQISDFIECLTSILSNYPYSTNDLEDEILPF